MQRLRRALENLRKQHHWETDPMMNTAGSGRFSFANSRRAPLPASLPTYPTWSAPPTSCKTCQPSGYSPG